MELLFEVPDDYDRAHLPSLMLAMIGELMDERDELMSRIHELEAQLNLPRSEFD